MERTLEPITVIEARGSDDGVPWVRYHRSTDTARWVIRGTCICCGACESGNDPRRPVRFTGIPIGQPGACVEIGYDEPARLDCPVTPDIGKFSSCSLIGEWLDGE